ncbi:MAG: hypothetical protein ABSG73_02890 [Candidatus Aminicenantales bacterium]|jgi:hypothetical protein
MVKGRGLESILAITLLAGAIVLSANAIHTYGSFYHDDAFISLRYSRNWINGQGLVWNPGERVEGYTNFLFVFLAAAMGLLKSDLVAVSRIIGIVPFAIICLVFAGSILRSILQKGNDILRLGTGAVFVLSSPAMWIWSFGGLETTFYALLLFMAILATVKRPRILSSSTGLLISGSLFALATLTKPEGALFFPLAVLYVMSEGGKTLRGRLKDAALLSIPFFAISISYWGWRILYYRDLFPNTFYAKGGFSIGKIVAGCDYLRAFAAVPPPYFVPGFILAVAALSISGRWNSKTRFYGIMFIAIIAFAVLWGGDHMPAYRLFIPVIPVFGLFLSQAIPRLFPVLEPWGKILMAVTALCLAGAPHFHPPAALARAKTMDQATFVGSIVGKYVNEHWPPDMLIALNTAGSPPYYWPEDRFVDMLGLNDRHIAKREIATRAMFWQNIPGHEKGDGKYVLSRKPDCIIIGPAEGSAVTAPWFLSDFELSQDKGFFRLYTKKETVIDVRGVPGYRDYGVTRTGALTFIYYQRTDR